MNSEYFVIQSADTELYYVYVNPSGEVVWNQNIELAHNFSTLLGLEAFCQKLKQTYKVQGRLVALRCTWNLDVTHQGTFE